MSKSLPKKQTTPPKIPTIWGNRITERTYEISVQLFKHTHTHRRIENIKKKRTRRKER